MTLLLCSSPSSISDLRSRSALASVGLRGTALGIFAPRPGPDSEAVQRSRRSTAVFSQIRLARYQPAIGSSSTTRRYSAPTPLNGGFQTSSTASPTTTASTRPPSSPSHWPFFFVTVLRSWKAPSHTSTPGRNSSPKTTITTVSRASRCCRIRLAARQCSTTVCGSMPKDCTVSLRPPPSIRTSTARANASPRSGSNSDIRPFFTLAPELAFTSPSSDPSRYAADESA